MIKIIDYGLGNLKAFYNIFKRENIDINYASTPEDLNSATKLILPGVGSFDYAMDKLNSSGMRDYLDDLVLKKKVPVLGVCIGMQIMAESSEEGNSKGLGWLNYKVKKLDNALKSSILLPHMGWNSIEQTSDCKILKDLVDPKFYFLHSYYFQSKDFIYCKATTNYNINFCSVFCKDNIYGVQFHPEKSHNWGEKLLINFSSI